MRVSGCKDVTRRVLDWVCALRSESARFIEVFHAQTRVLSSLNLCGDHAGVNISIEPGNGIEQAVAVGHARHMPGER